MARPAAPLASVIVFGPSLSAAARAQNALSGGIATVNADLGVGSIEETVTGAAPLDPTQQDGGATKGEDTQWFRMHNSGRSTQLRDGMFVGLPMGGANFNSAVNPATIDEVAVQLTGPLTAEAQGDGPQTNFVPRDGGNVFSDLRTLYDVGGGGGGPIARDRICIHPSTPLCCRNLVAGSNTPGVKQYLFGSDYPLEAYEMTVRIMPDLKLRDDVQFALDRGNAERLFPRFKQQT